MQKIVPFLWFDDNAEEAINFYTSVFRNSKTLHISRNENGQVFSASMEIEGQQFYLMNGGPHYQFTPAISLFVNCETQAEVDDLWEKLGEGGKELQCGWITDKFGLTWQIIPTILGKLMSDPNKEKAGRAMQAMLQMKKIDIAKLQAAYDGE